MTPEEREQLRRDLESAGCPWLAEGAGQSLSTMSDDEREELRSLLRRELSSSTGVERIASERQRQIESEGWSADHDSHHRNGELSMAAACYAAGEPIFIEHPANAGRDRVFHDPWPWDRCWDKRENHSRIRQLEIAGALIAAEIDRLQRIDAEVPDGPN